MVLIAALLLAAAAEPAPPPAMPVVAERQAVAMVRILPGAQLRFSEIEKKAPETLTDAQIRRRDGSPEHARLVEFQ